MKCFHQCSNQEKAGLLCSVTKHFPQSSITVTSERVRVRNRVMVKSNHNSIRAVKRRHEEQGPFFKLWLSCSSLASVCSSRCLKWCTAESAQTKTSTMNWCHTLCMAWSSNKPPCCFQHQSHDRANSDPSASHLVFSSSSPVTKFSAGRRMFSSVITCICFHLVVVTTDSTTKAENTLYSTDTGDFSPKLHKQENKW